MADREPKPLRLHAVRRLRGIELEQARLGLAHALAVQAGAKQEQVAVEQRFRDGAVDAAHAFEVRGDVQARWAWLDHLEGLQELLAAASAAGQLADRTVAHARAQVAAVDARLQAADALAARLALRQALVRSRRAADERDARWLARDAMERAAW